MEAKEMRMEFEKLYSIMANSNEPKYMHVFGDVMKDMMDCIINTNSELAQEFVERLSAIKWFNYLTSKEAMSIVNEMTPSAIWDISSWQQVMGEIETPIEEAPYYNAYALFVVMNQVVSDHGESIAYIKGAENVKDINQEELAMYAYRFAIDLLKDKDGVYDVRGYFL